MEDEYVLILHNMAVPYTFISQAFAWSADGAQICFAGSTSEQALHIATVPADGRSAATVHTGVLKGVATDLTWLNGDTVQIVMPSPETGTKQMFSVSLQPAGDPAVPKQIPGQYTDRWNVASDVTHDQKTLLYLSLPTDQ